MSAGGKSMKRKGVVALTLALSLVPAITMAATTQTLHKKRLPHPVAAYTGSLGSFTPAAADPRFGASFGRGGLESSGFRFTPSATPGSSRKVTVAIRSRAVTPQQVEHGNGTPTSLATVGFSPDAYNLGVAVGWKRFAVTSDYSKVDLGNVPGSREAADVAISYGGKRWSTRLALAANRPLGDTARLVDPDRNVSLDLGGSYSISNRLDVTGGVRYKVEKDRLADFSDDRRDSQAVYIGTAFKF
jgi:hypothetical protein